MGKMQVYQDLATAVNEVKHDISMKTGKQVLLKPPKGGELSEGYSVSWAKKKMIVGYHAHIRLEDINTKKFEGEIDENIEYFVKKVKEKYKEMTGKSVTLKRAKEEFDKEVFAASLHRAWVVARAIYELGSTSEDDDEDDED